MELWIGLDVEDCSVDAGNWAMGYVIIYLCERRRTPTHDLPFAPINKETDDPFIKTIRNAVRREFVDESSVQYAIPVSEMWIICDFSYDDAKKSFISRTS